MIITPNRVSVLRIIVAPMFVYAIMQELFWFAFGVFTLGVFSDFYDGYLARKHDLHSARGAYLDPLADKIFVLSAFGVFWWNGCVPSWVLMSIVMRDGIVTLIRMYTARSGNHIQTTWIAKLKTTLQFVALYWVLLEQIVINDGDEMLRVIAPLLHSEYRLWILSITAVVTVLSSLSYVAHGFRVLWHETHRN